MLSRINKHVFIGTFASLWVVAACSVKAPKGVLNEKQMEDVLVDYHIAKALSEELSGNTAYEQALYVDYVYNKHHITEAQFDSSVVFYTRQIDEFTKIYEKVNRRLQGQQDNLNHLIALRSKKPQKSMAGDSINLWYQQQMFLVSSVELHNKVVFNIPSDENFKEKDTIRLSARFRFMPFIRSTKAVVTMQLVFKNDSVLKETKQVVKNGEQTITLQGDSLGELREIRGTIYYQGQKSFTPALVVDRLSLMRYHQSEKQVKSLAEEKAKRDSLQKDTVIVPVTPTMDTMNVSRRRMNPRELRK